MNGLRMSTWEKNSGGTKMATKLILKTSQQITINPVIHSFIGFLPLNRIEFVERIEKPTRLVTQFAKLVLGIAAFRHKDRVTQEEIGIARDPSGRQFPAPLASLLPTALDRL